MSPKTSKIALLPPKANIALAKLNGLVVSIPNYEILLQPLTVREAVASSGIENIITTTLEVLQAELLGEKQSNPAEKETMHYKQALLFGYQSVKAKEFLATNQIIEMQEILVPEKPGIRKIPGTAVVNAQTKEVVHQPPQHETEIRNLLKNMDEYCNAQSGDVDPLIKMAVLHHQFETIHPFYDGNGRTGRILMVLYLVLTERLNYPVLFLSGYLLKNRQEYYRLLQEVRKTRDWRNWVLYILDMVQTQSQKTCDTIQSILSLMEQYKVLIKKKLPQLYSLELVMALFSHAFHNQVEFANLLGIHVNSAAKYLNLLEAKKIVSSKSINKKKVYFVEDFVNQLN